MVCTAPDTPAGPPACSAVSAFDQALTSLSVVAPVIENESIERTTLSVTGPMKDDGALLEPIWATSRASVVPRAPARRSIQPVRSPEPGAARSISAIASKWERVGAA